MSSFRLTFEALLAWFSGVSSAPAARARDIVALLGGNVNYGNPFHMCNFVLAVFFGSASAATRTPTRKKKDNNNARALLPRHTQVLSRW
jgi:hypothetical protein